MKQLNQREKVAMAIGGGAVLLFIVLQFIVFPLINGRGKLSKRVDTREKAIVEMRVLQERYQKISQQSGSMTSILNQRAPDFSLFSFLEKNAADSGVKELIAYMKPSESTESDHFKQSKVEMKLQAVGLKQLVMFLEQAESPQQLVGIDKIIIQDNTKEPGTLDVTMQIVSIDQVDKSASH